MGLLSNRIKIILLAVVALGAIVVIRQSTFMFVLNTVSVELPNIDFTVNDEYSPSEEASVLLVTDEKSSEWKTTILSLFDQLKMNIDYISSEEYENPSTNYEMVIVAVEEIENLGNPGAVFKYVEEGGHVFFAKRLAISPAFYGYYQALGIIEFTTLEDVTTLNLEGDYLSDFQQRRFEGNVFYNSSLVLQLLSDVAIKMRSDDKVPLLWERDFGRGEITYFNGTMTAYEDHQVVLYEFLSEHFDVLIHPIINLKMITLKEFPSPIYVGETDHIRRDYERDNRTFYREIWWPELLGLQRRFQLLYSTAVLTTYSDNVETIDINSEDYVYFAREILYQDGELGFHNITFNRLEGIHETWLPRYEYRFFMPIGDKVDVEDYEALTDVDNNISGIVADYYENGELLRYLEDNASSITMVPYYSKGYELIDQEIWRLSSRLKMNGVVHHVLRGNVENADPWRDTFDKFSKHFEEVMSDNNHLRPATITQSFERFEQFRSEDIQVIQDFDGVTIIPMFKEVSYLYLRTNHDIVDIKGGTYEEIGSNNYLIIINDDVCRIDWSK